MGEHELEKAENEETQRWRQTLLTAARWLLDVLRGHAWSRHLHQQEKK